MLCRHRRPGDPGNGGISGKDPVTDGYRTRYRGAVGISARERIGLMKIVLEYDDLQKVWVYRKFREGVEVHCATFPTYKEAWGYAEDLATDLVGPKL
jgi:hypothetical protein